ncbi:ADP-dependent glucokinase/phosphofructokinase [Arthrobacter burdickii]|uniref:ADP-dependent glucokinase/phosphofructokinase n=1 Tax=Arthrobacter burdickii TaxID=3035920 RepID=A0ABT8JWG3_9MICC|nr:ADP-dependent glucokinase/phosphofructokinase [Arthrobacter burdickii]MDN4609495.1 ADP-dependent glucokinase/phosphofructokinase [Arthrobacter burdickii]
MGTTLVLGLGGTVDYEVHWDAAVIESLASRFGIRRVELTTMAPIVDERSLVVTILGFVRDGAGGERFVVSSEVVKEFSERFATEITLGGTGVRAGIALDRLGIPSVQHLVSIDDNVRRLLPASMSYVSSATEDTLDPHLIVQYPAGTTIRLDDGEIVSPSSNRLIFANDPPNRNMAITPELGDALVDAAALLVSGFNTMQDEDLLERRLIELDAVMEHLPSAALVYYEDAGFYVRRFAERIWSHLLPRIDVYGMNEDELQEYVARPVDLLDPADVASALREVHRLIPVPALLVHTQHWAVMLGTAAERHREALESAVQMAATRYRLGDAFLAADFEATRDLPRSTGGGAVASGVERLIPGAVGVPAFRIETASPTTIGLGDSFVGGFLAVYAPVRQPQP